MQSAVSNRKNAVEQQWNVTVNSIGDAGMDIVSALRKALPLSDHEIARRLFQAPAILAENLSKPIAKQITDLLSRIGLDVSLIPSDTQFISGSGDFELSLTIRDYSRVYEILHLVMELTGLDSEQAIRMLNNVPAIFLANISENNVKVLKKRFEKLNVEFNTSKPEQATYDVFLQSDSYRSQQEFINLARSLNVDVVSEKNHTITSLVGLNYNAAQQLWQQASEKHIYCRILNRAYQRYNVTLQAIPLEDSKALENILVTSCHIPEKVLPNLLRHLPIVISNNVPLLQAQDLIAELQDIGVTATAELLSGMTFNIELDDCHQSEKITFILTQIGKLSKNKISSFLKEKISIIEGPFTYNQARWMISEFKKINCKAKIQRR